MADQIGITPFLSNTLARARGTRPTNSNTYRKYRAPLTTSSTCTMGADRSVRCINYEIGRRCASARDALSHEDIGIDIAMQFDTSAVVSDTLTALSRKYTNFGGTFKTTSLIGVVERIARSLAAWTLYPSVNAATMRAGMPYNIHALAVLDAPVSASNSYVFIPRLVDSVLTPNVFSVLASAVVGEGGSVITDALALDMNDRTPLIGDCSTEAFPRACVDALRILGANFHAADAGDQFSLGFTSGIHKVLSVVGHTDEGAVMRDIFRVGHYSVPFGGIHCGLENYVGIPALSSNQIESVSAYVDSVALTTAALVAHCDPGLIFDNMWYPSFFLGSSGVDEQVQPGVHTEGTNNHSNRIVRQMANAFPHFSRLYMPALCKMFSFPPTVTMSTIALDAKCANLAPDNRHLKHASVSPYFWIEPTSLIPLNFAGTQCEAEGFASKATIAEPHTKDAFERVSVLNTSEMAFSSSVVQFRTARACAFLDHWNGHKLNGLGAVFVNQIDPVRVVQPGGADNASIMSRVNARMPLSGYLWKRGQSPLCAPGEFYNLGGTLGLHMRHFTFDDLGIPNEEHLPACTDLDQLTVTYYVGIPAGVPNGASNFESSSCARARTIAAQELNAVTLRARLFGTPNYTGMSISFTSPRFPNERAPPRVIDEGVVGGGVSAALSNLPGGGIVTSTTTKGVPVNPIGHHGPHHAPQVQRQEAPRTGGGDARKEDDVRGSQRANVVHSSTSPLAPIGPGGPGTSTNVSGGEEGAGTQPTGSATTSAPPT